MDDMEQHLVIQQIRRGHGMDFDPATLSPEVREMRDAMLENIKGACQLLSDELYGGDVHWVYELLQNADDNRYPEGSTPSLVVQIQPDGMRLVSNEAGFSAADVKAICSIGSSTKKGNAGCIGEKGA